MRFMQESLINFATLPGRMEPWMLSVLRRIG